MCRDCYDAAVDDARDDTPARKGVDYDDYQKEDER
jgi:hypothetical protein